MMDCRASSLDTGVPAIGRLELLSTSHGLAAVLFCGSRRSPAAERWLEREVRSLVPAPPGEHERFSRQILDFLVGERREFQFPIHRTGTPFQRAVLDAVARVPYGSRASYGEIARAVGNPAASRAVGAANGANPLPLVLPCHRIVGASAGPIGSESVESKSRLVGYGGGLDAKRWLLAREASAALALAS